jgi:hypothetical protein
MEARVNRMKRMLLVSAIVLVAAVSTIVFTA